jgi:hypothetical protein
MNDQPPMVHDGKCTCGLCEQIRRSCEHGSMICAIQNAQMSVSVDMDTTALWDFHEAEMFIAALYKEGYAIRPK